MELDEERVRKLWITWKKLAWAIFKTAFMFMFFMWIYNSVYDMFGLDRIIIIGLVVVELQMMKLGDLLRTKPKQE